MRGKILWEGKGGPVISRCGKQSEVPLEARKLWISSAFLLSPGCGAINRKAYT